ncbi:MAG: bifunctional phosphopantothenoylcysteine decarboxylase/phosphopantothenate--cysteine ligase CoaBC [Rhodospirillales bacterium]|jgi:phosphopantothenoylcysteine decarboxylase / phosphopantothenate---cysteine ligase|nr:bifunctional phosphopantothenoylcysteine decarboxylase/phosphopantothenate--cysteine ligase CoaBC [Rhodospirillales bacterium]MBT4040118.1 bifunctional phosphopantothenoylcysteine decarboxylase/phosphopantothenate--cysteine ligase CoaBC [Rhodospirillales bacterium]MBT4625450.1 bifunctional phosphopantothenoylcysteine decarboxylase/phosphopantothenate--cysteine ligase CoaBC [Rhodospirillales bacterium]MBT5352088.1 bifunctional phosphopantothenoylcysteine decarboxylase/phosphopantothenate--cyst
MLTDKRILLIVAGGIAAYKTPELVRLIAKAGGSTRVILTDAGAQFVTPMTLGSVSGDTVYDDLFSLTEESDMGHIQLSREADLVVVAPATADLMAKMATGLATDLASTTLLATDKPVMIAPAMNVRMWEHAATQQNLQTLSARGVHMVGPEEGDMACGEYGMGRMAEPAYILAAIQSFFQASNRLMGQRALVTSGPTHEAIDPVRYIANRSSGKQGHAIAAALAAMGAETTLVSGPTNLPDPAGVHMVHVQSARNMLDACESALPAHIAVCAAAVADWRPADEAASKMKKLPGEAPAPLSLSENPDILRTLGAAGNKRPGLLIGFAAETDSVVENAQKKRLSKGCDWILANDVSAGTGTFGGDENVIHLVDEHGVEDWPRLSKIAVAQKLANRIVDTLEASR